MSRRSREAVLADIVMLLQQVAEDWEFSGAITEETQLFADMGLQSMDVVILGTAVQEHYGQVMPFPEFFAEIGRQKLTDLSVGLWVDFVHTQLNAAQKMGVEVSR